MNVSIVKSYIPKLEYWCGLKYGQVLYDSDFDGKSSEIFKNKIINHSHLYFIVIDSDYNIFGHYHNKMIDKIGVDINDCDIFLFTLDSNGRSSTNNFKTKKTVCTHIYDNGFYYCGKVDYDTGYYSVNDIDKANSRVHEDISHFFDVDDPVIFTGSCYSFGYDNFYKPKRVIVIEMNEKN